MNRNYILLVSILLVTILVSWKFYFFDDQQQDLINVQVFPKTISQWNSEDLPINKIDSTLLGTNILSRRYNAQGKGNVYLYIVYFQNDLKVANPPELFYLEKGFSILDKGKESIIIKSLNLPIKANWLLLDKGSDRRLTYYWFKIKDKYIASYWKQRILLNIYNFIDKRTSSTLIQISVDYDIHQQEAQNLIYEFANLITPLLPQYLP